MAVDLRVQQYLEQHATEEGRWIFSDDLQAHYQFLGDVLQEFLGTALVGLLEDGPPQFVSLPLLDVCH